MPNTQGESSSAGNMAATTSTRTFALSKDFRPAEVKLSNIEHLEGQQNYEDWSSQMISSLHSRLFITSLVYVSSPLYKN